MGPHHMAAQDRIGLDGVQRPEPSRIGGHFHEQVGLAAAQASVHGSADPGRREPRPSRTPAISMIGMVWAASVHDWYARKSARKYLITRSGSFDSGISAQQYPLKPIPFRSPMSFRQGYSST